MRALSFQLFGQWKILKRAPPKQNQVEASWPGLGLAVLNIQGAMRWIFLVKNKHVEQLLIMKNGFDSKNKEENEGEKKLFHVEH